MTVYLALYGHPGPIVLQVKKSARISRDRRYRYALRREWDPNAPVVCFIGLNPSTADERIDDPTVRRCIGFAQDWGYGGLVIGNLFAVRTAHPRVLRRAHEPVGRANDAWLKRLAAESNLVVAAWGRGGAYLNRFREVKQLLRSAKCLGLTKHGHPRHPLYVRKDAKLVALPYNTR